eukprot:TRINITY_DN0_c0_g1_i4.p1 TRINITY_DN0_c0_g1~~TRINITY_DN0_c0_g1_i4.p1  ORF type:complete len:667 (-),score=162.62 TRINITY_DN0_c0_g1_i4:189-2189(-)
MDPNEDHLLMEHQRLWSPSQEAKEGSQIYKLKLTVESRFGVTLASYQDLWKWSVENVADFWALVWEVVGIVHSKSYEKVVEDENRMFPVPEWFIGSRLNFAENLLRFNDEQTALVFKGEGEFPISITYKELHVRVARLAGALRAVGVTIGDRVAGYLPNCIDAIVAMLATTSIGAVWTSTSPDFGVKGVLQRFGQVEPKVLLSVAAVRYNGKVHDHLVKLNEVVEGLTNLHHVVMVPFAGTVVDFSQIKNSIGYEDFLDKYCPADNVPALTFEQLPFNHPVYILYSSGTTGLPKCIVHSAGGTLIQHLKEHIFHGDLRRNDKLFFYTTTGWMMWNWLVSGLAVGATVVLYDGSPFYPSPNAMFDLVDELDLTIFGTSAKFIAAVEAANVCPKDGHRFDKLRAILSTGSPLANEGFDFIYNSVKKDILLGSISGGTDLISCFAGSNPMLPVYRGEIQSPNLGMAIYAFDSKGNPITGDRGDLVCTKPFPSQPIYFWKDEDGAKYRKAYFNNPKGIWVHGDFVLINTATMGVVMLGRSDATLNPAGIRFGSSELYDVVANFHEVLDSVAIGQQVGADERVVLFLKMKPEHPFTAELVSKLKVSIREHLSARHVPSIILQVPDIPYTVNFKKVEIAIKRVVHGQEVDNLEALVNPECLEHYKNIPELAV